VQNSRVGDPDKIRRKLEARRFKSDIIHEYKILLKRPIMRAARLRT
jgi:hypothetical protein